ncbi:hypothetical protein GCM10023231_04760 [Olivibacter ginsenosidimutans]|uniref:Glycosyl hydrolase family 39 n=1 Tax=Olivibacter ginsenosidimutans TaxID=1176537 RepID=A0ABP9AFE5_9SPHI
MKEISMCKRVEKQMLGWIAIVVATLNVVWAQERSVTVQWNQKTSLSKTTPTLQVVYNPMLKKGSPIHEGTFQALQAMGADYVRFVPWFPYPQVAVAELKAPTATETFWDFSRIDPIVKDVMEAQRGHSVVMNFSTIPVWMFKTKEKVVYPSNPDEPFWAYNQGTELRDTTLKEVADYYVRLFSWYTKGGFTDELGKFHRSGLHYDFPYWEVLNEPDLEHRMTPQYYTKIYDAVVTALKKIAPATKFVGISVAHETNPEWFEYFLNPKNHQADVPLEGVSYHFYGRPAPDKIELDYYQYSFFDQANAFLDRVRYIENIRKRLAPQTFTQINEIGNILTGHDHQESIPHEYWNLAGAMYAYLYLELTKIGIDVAGESQLVGYPTQFPDVSMMNWTNAKPNARYWVLKLVKDHFGPGDQLVTTRSTVPEVSAQGFITAKAKKLLLINQRNKPVDLKIASLPQGAMLYQVDTSTGDNPPSTMHLSATQVSLKPFSVSVVVWP